jgi:hypothetical protein
LSVLSRPGQGTTVQVILPTITQLEFPEATNPLAGK